MARNRDVDAAVLSLAEQFKATTIEATLAKSDVELGLEVLTDHSPLLPPGSATATATIRSSVLI